MFVENSYWEQEARGVFNGEPNQSVNGYGKRNFRYMPIPKFIGVDGIKDQTNTERVLPAQFADSYICISAKNKNKTPSFRRKSPNSSLNSCSRDLNSYNTPPTRAV